MNVWLWFFHEITETNCHDFLASSFKLKTVILHSTSFDKISVLT